MIDYTEKIRKWLEALEKNSCVIPRIEMVKTNEFAGKYETNSGTLYVNDELQGKLMENTIVHELIHAFE
jgi:Zn-dependent peptidase ImmA (M78 family)